MQRVTEHGLKLDQQTFWPANSIFQPLNNRLSQIYQLINSQPNFEPNYSNLGVEWKTLYTDLIQ